MLHTRFDATQGEDIYSGRGGGLGGERHLLRLITERKAVGYDEMLRFDQVGVIAGEDAAEFVGGISFAIVAGGVERSAAGEGGVVCDRAALAMAAERAAPPVAAAERVIGPGPETAPWYAGG